MIKFYREDGQSKKNGELYFAAIGALIWPLQLLAFIRDWWNKKWKFKLIETIDAKKDQRRVDRLKKITRMINYDHSSWTK